MDPAYKQYLEALYSSPSGSRFLGLWEAADPALVAHHIVLGPTGFGTRARFPNLMISDENPRERILDWMVCCLDMAGIQKECHINIKFGPWVHIEILDRRKWLSSLWGMPVPQTNDIVRGLLLLSMDQSQALYFADKGQVLEVYIGAVKR